MSQTKKALREALDEIALRFVSGNKIQIDSARISRSEWLLLQAALSLPETQGEPVGENLEPLPPEVHEAINAYAAYYAEHHKLGMSIRNDMQYIASVALRFAPSSQPAQGEPFVCDSRVCHAPSNRCYGCPHYHGKASVCSYAPPSQPAQGWKLVPVELLQLPPLTDAMYHAVRGLELEFSSGGPESVMASINDETLDEIWDAINTALRTSKAMLAAAPAAPTQAKPTNGEGA